MVTKKLPDLETLNALFEYNADTGRLHWKPRPASMFVALPHRSAEEAALGFNRCFAGKPAGCVDGKGYIRLRTLVCNELRVMNAHRVIWKMHYGTDPELIDHINGNRADNRIENLRNANHTVNARNQRMNKNNTSGVTGVYWTKRDRHWIAFITDKGKRIALGYFSKKADAIAARKAAEKSYGYHPNHGRV